MSKLYNEVKEIDSKFASIINGICQDHKNEIEDIMETVAKEVFSKSWHNKFKLEKKMMHKDGSAWLNYSMVQNTDKENISKFNIDFFVLVNAKPKATNDDCFELTRKIKTIVKTYFAKTQTADNPDKFNKRVIRLYYPSKNIGNDEAVSYTIDIGVHILWKERELTYLTENNNVSKKPFEYERELTFKHWELEAPEGFKDAYRWALKSLKYVYYYANPNSDKFSVAISQNEFLNSAFEITCEVANQNPTLNNKKVKRRLICEEIERRYIDKK